MAVKEVPVTGHLAGTGSQELRNLLLWQRTTAPSPQAEGQFWYDSNSNNRRIWFRDAAQIVPVPRLDRSENVAVPWLFGTSSPNPPFYVLSDIKVDGFNADMVDGFHADTTAVASTVAARSAAGRIQAVDPAADPDVVTLGYLNARVGSLTLDGGRIQTGLVALKVGGTGADLSVAANTPQGGLIYVKTPGNGTLGVGALGSSLALTGVVIGNGANAPTAQFPLSIGYGGTGGTSPATARSSLDVYWAEDVRGLVDVRTPRGGLLYPPGTSVDWGVAGIHAGASNLGTSDFSISVGVFLQNYSPPGGTLFWSSSKDGGNNRTALALTAAGTFIIYWIDGAGAVNQTNLNPDVSLVGGTPYIITVSVVRSGLATLYINGVSDRNRDSVAATADVSAYKTINLGQGNAGQTGVVNQAPVGLMIYACRIFNFALSQSEVQDLSENGMVGLSDRFGSNTPIISPTLLNGGFETAGAGGADPLANWVETVSGTSTVTRDTTAFIFGVASCRLTIDGSGSLALIAQSNVLTIGRRYRLEFWAKADSVTGGPLLASDSPGANTLIATLTATWTKYSLDFIAANQDLSLKRMGGTGANRLLSIDDVTLTPLGVVFDPDLENVDPAKTTTVKDRSSYNIDLAVTTLSSQIYPKKQINTESLLVSSIPQSSVLYAGNVVGKLALVTGVPLNAGSTAFLTQTASANPTWYDLFGQPNTWTGLNTFNRSPVVPLVPTEGPTSAICKDYCDTVAAAGLRPLAFCPYATTGNITLSGDTQTIDGTVQPAGSRVLVKDQTAPAQNGIYIVQVGAWSRAADADQFGELDHGAYTFVQFGTANAGTSWYQTAKVTVVGTDPVTWVKFFQQAAYTAGTGIAIAGLRISVNQAESRLDWTGFHTWRNGLGIIMRPWGSNTGETTPVSFEELAANGSNRVGFKGPDSIPADCTWALPSADGVAASKTFFLRTDGNKNLFFGVVNSTDIINTGFVTSVTGTLDRITTSGAQVVTVDIAATYAGQASITTLGIVTTGTWRATPVDVPYGGTGKSSWVTGDLIFANTPTALAGLPIGVLGRILISSGVQPLWTTYSMPSVMVANGLLYASTTSQVSCLATSPNKFLTTDGAGVPVWSNTLPAGVVTPDASKILKAKWFSVGDGVKTLWPIIHNFATNDVVVHLYENTGPDFREYPLVPTTRTDINTVTLEFISVPTTGQFKAMVIAAS